MEVYKFVSWWRAVGWYDTAVGCSNLVPPSDAWLRRTDNEATIGCYTTRQRWNLRCDGNQWTGTIGLCSHGWIFWHCMIWFVNWFLMRLWNRIYTVSQKRRHYTLVHIFAKYWPIFTILSPFLTHGVCSRRASGSLLIYHKYTVCQCQPV